MNHKYIHTCITPFYFQKSIEGVCTIQCTHMHTIHDKYGIRNWFYFYSSPALPSLI
jgi:hypothetical protein